MNNVKDILSLHSNAHAREASILNAEQEVLLLKIERVREKIDTVTEEETLLLEIEKMQDLLECSIKQLDNTFIRNKINSIVNELRELKKHWDIGDEVFIIRDRMIKLTDIIYQLKEVCNEIPDNSKYIDFIRQVELYCSVQ